MWLLVSIVCLYLLIGTAMALCFDRVPELRDELEGAFSASRSKDPKTFGKWTDDQLRTVVYLAIIIFWGRAILALIKDRLIRRKNHDKRR